MSVFDRTAGVTAVRGSPLASAFHKVILAVAAKLTLAANVRFVRIKLYKACGVMEMAHPFELVARQPVAPEIDDDAKLLFVVSITL